MRGIIALLGNPDGSDAILTELLNMLVSAGLVVPDSRRTARNRQQPRPNSSNTVPPSYYQNKQDFYAPSASQPSAPPPLPSSQSQSQGSQCPSGHSLGRQKTHNDTFACDVCGKSVSRGTTMYGCRVCNWDACEACEAAIRSSYGPSQPVRYAPSAPPAPSSHSEQKTDFDSQLRSLGLSNGYIGKIPDVVKGPLVSELTVEGGPVCPLTLEDLLTPQGKIIPNVVVLCQKTTSSQTRESLFHVYLYEKSAWDGWLRTGANTNPLTRTEINQNTQVIRIS